MYMAQVLSQGNEEADKREEMVMSRDSWAAGGSHSTRSKRARAPCQRSYSILAEDGVGGGGGSFELRLSCLLVAGDGCQRCLRTVRGDLQRTPGHPAERGVLFQHEVGSQLGGEGGQPK